MNKYEQIFDFINLSLQTTTDHYRPLQTTEDHYGSGFPSCDLKLKKKYLIKFISLISGIIWNLKVYKNRLSSLFPVNIELMRYLFILFFSLNFCKSLFRFDVANLCRFSKLPSVTAARDELFDKHVWIQKHLQLVVQEKCT